MFSSKLWSLLRSSAYDFASCHVSQLRYSTIRSDKDDFNNKALDFESQIICQLSSLKFLTHPNGKEPTRSIYYCSLLLTYDLALSFSYAEWFFISRLIRWDNIAWIG